MKHAGWCSWYTYTDVNEIIPAVHQCGKILLNTFVDIQRIKTFYSLQFNTELTIENQNI